MFDARFTFGTRLALIPIADVRPTVEAALKAEGFGVLTEIDVQATVKTKLGIDRSPFLILGTCNPALSHRLLGLEPALGALLPCNVVLREDGNALVVEAMDPAIIRSMVDDPDVAEVAEDTRGRLRRAIAVIEAAFPAAG
jgi:uncharacterized protein (DUF302 family)